MSSLVLSVIRELYLDTERPVIVRDIEELDLNETDDEELKLQHNCSHIFSLAFKYASPLMR